MIRVSFYYYIDKQKKTVGGRTQNLDLIKNFSF